MEEIARIAERSPVGVEIFVHGSMCYSYSGKCFFSSYLGGKSGNRGVCVQPCRRLYGHGGDPDAIFSTRDLSLLPHLPDLVPLGITALKIEGRMRGAEYVAGIVSGSGRGTRRRGWPRGRGSSRRSSDGRRPPGCPGGLARARWRREANRGTSGI
jgi:putative protease